MTPNITWTVVAVAFAREALACPEEAAKQEESGLEPLETPERSGRQGEALPKEEES